MVDGFYRIVFTGAHGSGFGILVLRDGYVAGADVGGALYDGQYKLNESGDHLVIDVTMRAPAGIVPGTKQEFHLRFLRMFQCT